MATIVISTIRNYFLSFAGLPKECSQGILLSFFQSALASVYYFLSIYFVNVLHMKISTAGIMISFYGLGTILGGYIGGKLSDKILPKTVSSAGLLGQAITFLALIQLKSPFIITIDLFILGVSAYIFITSNYVSILSYCKDSEAKRLKAINILNVASNLGIGLAALLIGEFTYDNFKYVFYLSGILLFSLAIISTLQQNLPIRHDIEKISNLKKSSEEIFFYTGLIKLVLICLFFTGMIVSQLSTTYSIYLKEKFPHLGLQAFSIFFSLNACLVVIFQNYLVSKFSANNKIFVIGFGSFLIGLGTLLLNFSSFFIILLLSCIIYSAGEMIFFSMVQLFCYEKSGENQKGRSLGTYRMIYALSRFVGPTIGGNIYYCLGGSILWYLSGMIGLIFFILCHHYKKLV